MSETPLRVLLVEGDPDDARRVAGMLQDRPVDLTTVSRLAAAVTAVQEQPIDVALLDLDLADSSGVETYHLLQRAAPLLPIVIFSGGAVAAVALEAVRDGAQDYLVKGAVDALLLERCLRYAVERMQARVKAERVGVVLRMSRDINRLILQETDPWALCRRACALLVQAGGYPGAWIILADRGGPAQAVASGVRFRAAELKRRIASGRWPTCHDLAARQPGEVVLVELHTCEDCLIEAMPRDELAMVSLLQRGGESHGMLGVIPGGPVDGTERDLLRGAARDIGAALHDLALEEERRAVEARYRQLFEASPAGVAVYDPVDGGEDFVIQDMNSAGQRISRVRRDEVVGRRVTEVFPEVARMELLEALRRVNRTGDPESLPESRYEDERLIQWVENRLFKLDNGQVVAVFEDVTEKRALQAQVAQSDRLASVGLLAAGVAHEINNPLTYVLYNLEALTEDLPVVTDTLTRALATIGPERAAAVLDGGPRRLSVEALRDCAARAAEAVDGAHRVKKIVRDLRTFSRVDEAQQIPVSLNEVIDGAMTMAFNEIKYRARVVKDYGPLPTLLANEGKLAQVFLNLVVNAAHAIAEGDVQHNEIRLVTREEGGEVVTEVRDTGCGIPEGNRGRLFDPFFTTKQVGQGSGLGLSICHTIVAGMDGSIEVESAEGEGSCFRVRLPVTSAAPATPAAAEAPAEASPRGRFLIVDDEPHVAKAIKRLYEKEHDFVLVTSGGRAREVLQDDRSFDGIICDLMMPDVTGMDLHAWLEETEPRLARAMIFVTGGAFTPRAKAFLRCVGNPALEKPFDIGAMRSWLHGQTREA